ncbi:MAG: nucleotidyltransferase domain-containing protein [Candidatus Bathyarchaeia archaeon]
MASGVIRNLEEILQERYVKLLCEAFHSISKSFDLTSFAVYGTVARGTAKRNSDADVLVVSNDFVGSLGSRIERLCRIEQTLREELAWLRKHGINTSLSFYPLRQEEAAKTPLLFLDLTEDAVIFHDKGRFLETILVDLRARLLKRGARRIFLNEEKWYWDLKPDYKFGEGILI